MGGGDHNSYTCQCGLVGSFTSPGIDTRYKGRRGFSVSSERHWQSGVNGIANVPKRSFPQWDSSPSSSDISAGQRFQPHNRTLEVGSLEWVVETTIVTHSSADWWDLLLPLA